MDMELRTGDADSIRHLFDRVTSLSLSSKKMKNFFKRYLEYAKTTDDATLVDKVKEKARSYIEAKAS